MSDTLEHVSVGLGGRLFSVERRINFPIDAVWRALTQPNELARWLAKTDKHLGETGARRQLHFANTDSTIHATVTTVQSPHVLEYTWDDQQVADKLPEQALVRAAEGGGTCRPQNLRGFVRWELASQGKSTTVSLNHFLAEPQERPDFIVAAWQTHLDQLGAALGAPASQTLTASTTGEGAEWPWQRWNDLQERYAAALS